MSDPEPARPDLLDLAYPYALDAVAEIERRHIDDRLRAADAATAAEFTALVHGVHEAMAAVSALDARRPPAHVEHAVLRAIDAAMSGAVRTATDAAGTSASELRVAAASELRVAAVGDVAKRRCRADSRRRLGAATPHRPTGAQRLGTSTFLPIAAAAALAVLAGLGAAILLRQQESTPPAALRADTVLGQPDVRGRAAELPAGGTLTVTSSARLGAATVSFAALPEPPAGHCYQMWLLAADGTPRSVGVMEHAPTPGSNVVLRTGADDALAVTVEPAHGSALPTGIPLVRIPLA
ncbi:anti-sigma factor [Nocardia asteroides]|uniref:anti-sigma factor n=1 Tax=Nocardia asteroides TaxID=1824 RepID=UPI001E454E41|nr:anti-sigma factor [Nocardia asteroides]UGT60431.1 anti-sigma factor [Nocardia asteroides]